MLDSLSPDGRGGGEGSENDKKSYIYQSWSKVYWKWNFQNSDIWRRIVQKSLILFNFILSKGKNMIILEYLVMISFRAGGLSVHCYYRNDNIKTKT